jgi:hypothetical protein
MMRSLALFLLLLSSLGSYAQEVIADDISSVSDTVQTQTDESPVLHKDLMREITKKVLEPAFTKCFEPGKVYLSFTISKSGEVKEIKVVQRDCIYEAKEPGKELSLPLSRPGTKNGEPIEVRYSIPVYID